MSIVMIELDQLATGKTSSSAIANPTCSNWTSICSIKAAAAPVTHQFYREFPVVEKWPKSGGRCGDCWMTSSRAIISRSFASASLRPYSRDIRFPPFARTRASDSFR